MRFKALFLLFCLLPLPLEVEADAAEPARAPTSVDHALDSSVDHSVTEAGRLFLLGNAAEDEAAKRGFHEAGFKLAEAARAAEPANPGALLQWTMHASAIAALDKNLAALARIKEIEATLLRLKEIDAAYDHAAADRTLGLLYRNAPMIISVGSTARAGRHLKEAFAKAPAYPGNCIFLADFYLSEGEKREARRLAKECGAEDKLAKFPEHAGEWSRLARRILDKTRS